MRRRLTAPACLAVALGLLLPAARAEVVQRGTFRVAVDARLTPKRLPRSQLVPVRFAMRSRFIAPAGELPPQLRRIRVEINRHGHLDRAGLPVCHLDQIQPSTTANALHACHSSLVGEGYFAAKVRFTQQSPFPSEGRLLAFNGTWHGRPAILAHIYGAKPAPASITVPFAIATAARGTYGTVLSASLPSFSSRWGYVTEISMNLGRRFSSRGQRRSYLSAACPAPSGISLVSFPLSRARFAFTGHRKVNSTLVRSCRAAGR